MAPSHAFGEPARIPLGVVGLEEMIADREKRPE